ncbi:MAG: zf-HC2 domain-containing protein [Dysosmobacter sp.]
MKNDLSCAVVRDLLPAYAEGLTAPETNEAVERHLAACPACAARFAAISSPETAEQAENDKEVDDLKTVRRPGRRRVVLAVALTVLALIGVLAAMVFIIGSPADRKPKHLMCFGFESDCAGTLLEQSGKLYFFLTDFGRTLWLDHCV